MFLILLSSILPLPTPLRKRLSCSESSFTESDSSPPSGVRRRFSALMETHRFTSPLEADGEMSSPVVTRQATIKTRGTSLEGATMPALSSLAELTSSPKDSSGASAGGQWPWDIR